MNVPCTRRAMSSSWDSGPPAVGWKFSIESTLNDGALPSTIPLARSVSPRSAKASARIASTFLAMFSSLATVKSQAR